MNLRLVCAGVRPLLMYNVRLSSPLDPYAKKLRTLRAKRNKTDEDHWEIARVEFEGGMYYADLPVGPYVPGENLFRSLIGGARQVKAGMKIERGVSVADFELPLIYQGPRDIDGLWGDGQSRHVDIRPVMVQRQKVQRCRPIFPEWKIEAEVAIDPQVIDYDDFPRVTRLAGEVEGLGDFRRMFGRYSTHLEQLEV